MKLRRILVGLGVFVVGVLFLLPTFIGCYWDDKATNYSNNGKYEEAIYYYNKVIALQNKYINLLGRDNSYYYSYIGEDYKNLGKYEISIKNHQKALALSKNLSNIDDKNCLKFWIYYGLSRDYYLLKNYKLTLKYFKICRVYRIKDRDVNDRPTVNEIDKIIKLVQKNIK